ncbi:MAG: formyltetrahydrofolate deformylase [Alphaproteobacteria bacterium]
MIMTLSCPDQPGIVARVSAFLFERGCNILDAQQYNDEETRRFFMRVHFIPGTGVAQAGKAFPTKRVKAFSQQLADKGADIDTLRGEFESLAGSYGMHWTLRATAERRKVLILVSGFHHCLADLLYRWRIGELPMDVVAVVSNHERGTLSAVDLDGIPFHHLPVTPKTKFDQEAELLRLIESSGAELVVLARYMQILSPGLAAKLEERCINIHHSFLPGFAGAKPYHQAHARGVKTIGATAHYVTGDLDEGPIIEQDVERITHRDTPADLIRKGRDIERRVLARAVRWRLEDRVLLNGRKTVVFTD